MADRRPVTCAANAPKTPRAIRTVLVLLEMIKFEHTVFALPFALMGAVLAAQSQGRPHSLPPWPVLGWIVVAMVGARTTAMTVNRIVDAQYDRQNPRTAGRAIPAGAVRTWQAWLLAALGALLLFVAAARLNALCLRLAPVALLAVTGYSWTKRFTRWTHVALGAADGIAPVGAWLGVTGEFGTVPVLLWLVVTLWIAGFDIIYALQDIEVDRRLGIRSLPAEIGPARALRISFLLHAAMLTILGIIGIAASLGGWYYAGVIACGVLLGYEHAIVRPDDFSRVNLAFFTLNGWVAVLLFAALMLDRW